ncbi:hypothetical protein Bca52824_055595 [Brassica carinata]|uniref:Uncharacterized protein n=1 Tax=Brassica carinata TaxID=52824 RepID=A0A8X7R9N3_BRACI|nr:hypothetical protein Bca52824_055595 [Brassica carinata]
MVSSPSTFPQIKLSINLIKVIQGEKEDPLCYSSSVTVTTFAERRRLLRRRLQDAPSPSLLLMGKGKKKAKKSRSPTKSPSSSPPSKSPSSSPPSSSSPPLKENPVTVDLPMTTSNPASPTAKTPVDASKPASDADAQIADLVAQQTSSTASEDSKLETPSAHVIAPVADPDTTNKLEGSTKIVNLVHRPVSYFDDDSGSSSPETDRAQGVKRASETDAAVVPDGCLPENFDYPDPILAWHWSALCSGNRSIDLYPTSDDDSGSSSPETDRAQGVKRASETDAADHL